MKRLTSSIVLVILLWLIPNPFIAAESSVSDPDEPYPSIVDGHVTYYGLGSADADGTILNVDIDIMPDSYPNFINPASKGVIPVAILTTDDFDATTVDASTLTFGPGGARKAHKKAHYEDTDGDGDIDLLLHFRTKDSGIAAGDGEAMLHGETFDGLAIVGGDEVIPFQPSIAIVLDGSTTAQVGEPVTYFFTITNNSSSDSPDLILQSITDTLLGDLTAAAIAAEADHLTPGSSATFAVTRVVLASDPDPLENIVTVIYRPAGFAVDILASDDHSVDID
jgi:uncharacterized repeat protein (TIGR01451 family)